MFAVEVGRGAVGDEELAAVGVFAFVGHADDAAAGVRQRPVQFVGEGAAPDAGPAFARAGRVAPLQHEVADVAVEYHVPVVALLGQLHEVPDRARGEFREELEVEIAEAGLDPRVAFLLDPSGLQHVFFVGQKRPLVGGVRCQTR